MLSLGKEGNCLGAKLLTRAKKKERKRGRDDFLTRRHERFGPGFYSFFYSLLSCVYSRCVMDFVMFCDSSLVVAFVDDEGGGTLLPPPELN